MLEANQHGKYFFPTAQNGVSINLSFILGQIHDKYTDFILIAAQHAAYGDLCRQLIMNNARLEHHIQLRSFERLYEFEQFLQEMSQGPNKAQVNQSGTHVLHYSKEHLFHPCPFESREQSSSIYRFGELLYHLDTEHGNVKYEYCTECQTMIDERNLEQANLLAKHIEEHHWKDDNGFQLSIRSTWSLRHLSPFFSLCLLNMSSLKEHRLWSIKKDTSKGQSSSQSVAVWSRKLKLYLLKCNSQNHALLSAWPNVAFPATRWIHAFLPWIAKTW